MLTLFTNPAHSTLNESIWDYEDGFIRGREESQYVAWLVFTVSEDNTTPKNSLEALKSRLAKVC